MAQTDNASDLPQHLKNAPPIILDVLEAFKITQRFVAGIDDYHPKRAQTTSRSFGRFTTEWVAFLDRYAILMWDSRDICINARIQIEKLKGVFTFAKQEPPNFNVIKAKVDDYINHPDTTAEKHKKLVEDLKKLDSDIREWKIRVFDFIDKYVPKKDDGTSTYRMLMKDLEDLKKHLPMEDRKDMKSAWFSDSLQPTTVCTVKIQGAWLGAWYDAQVVVDEIKDARNAASLKKLRLAIEKASSDYQKLDSGCESYEGDLHKSDLYWAYKNAIDRQGR